MYTSQNQNGNENGNGTNGNNKKENDLNIDWPRFLVMQDSVKDSAALKKLSPFAISKGLIGIAGEPKSVKKTSFGLLIEVSKKSHADNLLKTEAFANIPVKVTPHRTLNIVKGVIRCREMSGMSEAEIAKELHDQSVTDVKRIFIHRRQTPTDTYILTFSKTELPTAIKVGYMNVKVNPYIPNPLRCYKCQEYGHGSDKCTREEKCSRCGQGHSRQNCTADEPHCVHCSLNHETSDRGCQRYQQEKLIQKLKVTEKISFPEARKRVLTNTDKPTYAATVSKAPIVSKTIKVQVSEQETQTALYWVVGDKPSNTPPSPKPKTAEASINTEAKSTEEPTQQDDATSAAQSTDRFDLLKKYAAEVNPSSPILNWQSATKSKSTSELPAINSEVGPTPPPSVKPKTSGIKFPLTPKLNNSKDKSIKTAPRTKVSGPK